MAIVYATKTGNWSDTTVWNTGALPTIADDVYSSNFTVTINTNINVQSLSNAGASGVPGVSGTFIVSANGISVTCTAAVFGITAQLQNNNTVLTFAHSSGTPCSLNANLAGPGTSNTTVRMSGSGTLNYTGNVYINNVYASAYGTFIINNGTVNIAGNVIGTGSGIGINIGGATTVVTVNATTIVGGGAGVGHGIYISSGTLNITGEVTGGDVAGNSGVNSLGGTTTITGTISGSAATQGLINNGGTVYHIGTAQASATSAAIGPGSAAQVTILTGPLLCNSPNDASAGVNPCLALRWFPADTALGTFEYRMRGATASGSPSARPARQMFLTNAYTNASYPSTTDVRKLTTYGPGSVYTGTLAVPIPSAVLAGVPVDNTFGTVFNNAVDVWNVPVSFTKVQEGSLGQRMSNSATIQSMGAQLTALGS